MKSNIILKISILILILFSIFCDAQKIKLCLTTNDFSENKISFLKSEFGNKKSFDSVYKYQILTTVFFSLS